MKTLGLDPPAGRVRAHRRLFRAARVRDRPARRRSTAATPISRCGSIRTSTRTSSRAMPIVTISLKPIGGIPGDASADQIDLMADLAERYSHRRTARHPRAEHRPAARPQARSLRDLAGARRGRAGHRQSRSDQRHHRLPRPRLLQPRQRPLDPGRAEDRRRASPIPTASAISASSSSRSRAASTPAAITMPATSASSASIGRARRITSCCSADRARRMRASPRSSAPASPRTASSMRSRRRPTSICASAPRASASSTPIAASAWRRSRRRSMGELPALPRRRAPRGAGRHARRLPRPDQRHRRPARIGRGCARADPASRPARADRDRLPQIPRRARLFGRAHPARGRLSRASCARRATCWSIRSR